MFRDLNGLMKTVKTTLKGKVKDLAGKLGTLGGQRLIEAPVSLVTRDGH